MQNYRESVKLLIDENIDEIFKHVKGFDIRIPGARIKKKRASDAFKKYLNSLTKYCNYLNPIVCKFKDSDNFYNFYVNLDLNYNGNTIKSVTAKKIMKVSKNIIITGITGSGKSTLMKHLFFNFLLSENKYIPFFVELRRIKNVETIEEYLYKSLGKNLSFTKEEFSNMLDIGKFVFLFDGTDERDLIDSKIFIENVSELRDRYDKNIYILTARPNEEFFEWHNFSQLEINQLNKEKMIEIIKKLNLKEELKNSFIKTVTEKLYKTHKSFLSNPLLIIIMILTFIEGGSVPLKMNLFFDRAFSTIYYKHDASKKIDWTRLMLSKLDINEFKNVFSFFCFYTYYYKETSFSKARILEILKKAKNYTKLEFDEKYFFIDLFKSVCLIVKDKFEINRHIFAHVAFENYFVALFVKNLSINERTRKKELINYIFIREGYKNNLIYEILFDEDLSFLESEVVIPFLEELKSATSYGSLDILDSFKLFCKFISEKKINGNKEKALDINIDIFLEDLLRKYKIKYSFEEFAKQFIKENIDNADMHTYRYFENLFEEILFTDNKKLTIVKKIPPIEIKINTKEFFTKISNSIDVESNDFSEPEIYSLKNLFLLYFYLMYILTKIKVKYNSQKSILEEILK